MTALTPSDFNGDGKADILWRKPTTGEVGLWLMNGTSVLSTSSIATVTPDLVIAGTGDFNNDGQSDILWRRTSSGEVSVWFMNGAAKQSEASIATPALDWVIVGTGDFNADGKTDILWRKPSTGDVAFWLMNGTGIQSAVVTANVPVDWTIAGTGDFNSDGKVDILWRKPSTGDVAFWLMNGTAIQSVVVTVNVPTDWVIAGAGDLNGDGITDILWRKPVTGAVGLWLMNAVGVQSTSIITTVPTSWGIAGLGDPNSSLPVLPVAPAFAANESEAARFLIQASFGPTASSITQVRAKTYAVWLDEQMALPPTYHLPYYQTRAAEFLARSDNDSDGYFAPRQEAWWQFALTAPDQLRQRMAFALSEILVISQDSTLDSENEGVTMYYDLLVRGAFGNYRQLLEDVTLSPMMGTYLSMIRNRKPNPTMGSKPDENYAREIMQLFSIGLSELNIDGTLRLGADGKLIPTYTQADIAGLAHVFTGWGPHFDPANPPKWDDGTTAKADDWFRWGWDPLQPMTLNAHYVDLAARQILGGVAVPAALTGQQRLKLALDTIFNHPNVGPFLARQLIQRFVTSNPSPAYIKRVATAFNNNGSGVRGDLGATLRAVLLDFEARRAVVPEDHVSGKMVEPLIRMTRMFRAFPPAPTPHAATGDNRFFLNFVWDMQEQSPLMSPTVFNFFKPGFAQPGSIATAGLVSPEFQVFNDTTSMWAANRNFSQINWGIWVDEPSGSNDSSELNLNLAEPLAILTTSVSTHAAAQAALVDYFNQRLLAGNMSPFLRQKILDTYTSLPRWFDYSAASELERVQLGLYLVLFSPEFNIQH